MRIQLVVCIFIGCFIQKINAQFVEVTGTISASDQVEGIHVINKTASKFSISNDQGEFTIPVKLNDTLLFSGISYQPKEIVVTKLILASHHCNVYLEELVTVLDEVIVGNVLTGNLLLDINNSDLKPAINFYNLGIPGYTGKLKTQTERRLYEATSGGGLIPIIPIINAISGRTKMLKAHVKLERMDDCLDKIKIRFAEDLFSTYELEDARRAEFFYYCQDDAEFETFCKFKNDLATIEFLISKLKDFKLILQSQEK